MYTYKLYTTSQNTTNILRSDGCSFLKIPDNTDYQQFVRDIKSGAQLNDAEGNPITGAALTTFMETLP